MFKGLHKNRHDVQKEPIFEGDLTTLCANYIEHPHDSIYNTLVKECANIGNRHLMTNLYIPPFLGRTAYLHYDGTGTINVDRTIKEICTNGRSFDSIIARKHVKDKQRNSLAILIDNSAQMTANWIGNKLGVAIKSEKAPQILVKIAAISILKSLGRKADKIDIIIFGQNIEGPFNQWQLSYKQILNQNGSGPSRLDLGLAKLLQLEWEMRPGNRFLFILGGGLPYTGTNIILDDIETQINVLYYLIRMMRHGVRVVYFPFFTEQGHLDEHVGAFSTRGITEKMKQVGVNVVEIENESSLPLGLKNGFGKMIIGPIKKMPVFEL